MREKFGFWSPVQVRWGDMDALGHVNNATYLTYLETARLDYFSHVGVDDFWDGVHGPIMARAELNYKLALTPQHKIEVATRISHLGRSSITLEHAIFLAGEETVAADGVIVAVWCNYAEGRSVPLPEKIRESIAAFEGERLAIKA
jgi:acyl-CoA thioester hydrolase